MKLTRKISAIFGLTLAIMASQPSLAQSYRARDAVHVTSSKNIDVLSYVVCLKEESDKQPRRLTLEQALDNAMRECRADAANLPRGRGDPTAEDIKVSILECGFKPGDASADAACDGDGPSVRADTITSVPTKTDAGKWLEGIAYDGKDIWAAESGQRTTAQIDFNSGRVIERHKVGRLPIAVATDGGGDTYTLVATDQKVLVTDRLGSTSTLTDLTDYPEGMVLDGAAIWVLASPGGSSANSVLVRVDTRTGKQVKSRDLGENATDLLVINDEVWVAHSRRAEISILDKTRLGDTVISVPNADIWKLATDFNYVYGAGRPSETSASGLVVKINPSTRQEDGRTELPEMIREIATDGTFVFAIGESGKIWIISAVDMQVQRLVEAQTVGAKFAPTGVLIIEDLLVVAARQFYDASGNPIKDNRRNDDENGAILLFGNILPDGNFTRTEPPAQNNRPRAQRPTRPTTNATPTRPVANGSTNGPSTATTTRQTRPTTTGRPNRPGAIANNGRPSRPTATSGGRGNNGASQRPISNASRAGFPVTAGSRGGNVRSTPSATGPKITSTGAGQPVTLVENTGKMLNGYPWFKIRTANGTIGYQWGGGICANPRTPVQGTKGICDRQKTRQRPATSAGNRPSADATTGQKADGVDVAIKLLDIFGKFVDSANQSNNSANSPSGNPNVFTQTLKVAPRGQGVVAARTVSQGQAVVYTVKGRRGQTLDVNVWSPRSNAVFEIYVGDAYDGGKTMPGAAAGSNTQDFRDILPEDNAYKIVVGSVNGDADFQLVVALEPATKASAGKSGGRSAAPQAALSVSQAPDWTQNPQDSRADNDYSGVPNAYWQICETANYDANSPDYNNETAYWDCALEGLAAGADEDTAYDHVQPEAQQNCLMQAGSPADPRSNPVYNSCMLQAEDNALEALEDAGEPDADANADPRSTKAYDTISGVAWNACWQREAQGQGAVYDCLDIAEANAATANATTTGPDLNPGGAYSALEEDVLQTCQGDVSCLDAAVSQASRANAQGIDYRLSNEFADLTDEDLRLCAGVDYGSEDFFNCLESVRAKKSNPAATQEPGWDRADVFYQPAYDHCTGQLGLAHGSPDYETCYYAYPNYQAAQPSNDDPTGALGQIQGYCESTYAGDQAAQCYAVGAVCFESYPDLNTPEFGACTQGW
jgi:hypothetical protein